MKKLKAFTLVELIVVMAILSILMVGIMNMMKPIRGTYVDSTYYEAQRTAQNGIVKYLTESTRYATNLGIYTEGTGSVNSLEDAVAEFKTLIGQDAETDEKGVLKLNIITVNNTTEYEYGSKTCKGRIVRAKGTGTDHGAFSNDAAGNGVDGNTDDSRIAMGKNYYGDMTYSVRITSSADAEYEVVVSSMVPSSLKRATIGGTVVGTGDMGGYEVVSTNGYVHCRNLTGAVMTPGKFDVSCLGNTTANDKNTYIIYTLPED